MDPTGCPSPDGKAAEQSICARFEQQVVANPNHRAVADEGLQFTYAQLNATANRIARAILLKCPSCEPVALLLGQGALAVAAILGVLKTGRIYTKMDPAIPNARTAQMLDDSEAKLLVTDQSNLTQARLLGQDKRQILCCDDIGAEVDDSNLGLAIAPETPALILYTSGSTGRPKGVLHTHSSIVSEVRNYARNTHPGPGDALSLCTSMSFAMSVRNLYGALLNGAALYPYDLAHRGFGQFADWIQSNGITILYMTSTAFRGFGDSLPHNTYFPSIRILRVGGEPLNGEDVRRHRHHFPPGCMLYHSLGPTEGFTVIDTFTRLHSCDIVGRLPVGTSESLPDRQVLLLDDLGNPVGTGEIGHIVVRSKYLALCYWRNPRLTEAVFLPDPNGGEERRYKTGDLGMRLADGRLMHMGRQDSQVKIRGYRVEVTEIEVALREFDSVKAAVVEARPRDDGEKALIAYVVPAEGSIERSVRRLRQGLSQKLPDYMIPSAFVWIDYLPSLPNGKVDRHALPPAPALRPSLDVPFTAPRTSTEAQVASIWEEILSLDEIGVFDPFLELGGDSLQGARLLASVKAVLGVELTLEFLFKEGSTVAGMAREIEAARSVTAGVTHE